MPHPPKARSKLELSLKERDVTLDAMGRTLASTLPHIISLSLRPLGSENHLLGLVADIVERLNRPQQSLGVSAFGVRPSSVRLGTILD